MTRPATSPIFGFGLKRFEEVTEGRFLQVVLVYGGSVTALTTVLVYSLIPEFELPDTFPPDLVALDPYRLITLG